MLFANKRKLNLVRNLDLLINETKISRAEAPISIQHLILRFISLFRAFVFRYMQVGHKNKIFHRGGHFVSNRSLVLVEFAPLTKTIDLF